MNLIFGSKESLTFIDKHSKKNLLAKAKEDNVVKALLAQRRMINKKIKNKMNELMEEYVKTLYSGASE